MPRGRDTRRNKKRIPPKIFRNLDPTAGMENVMWVNFADPSQLHPRVEQYLNDLVREKTMKNHPTRPFDQDEEQ